MTSGSALSPAPSQRFGRAREMMGIVGTQNDPHKISGVGRRIASRDSGSAAGRRRSRDRGRGASGSWRWRRGSCRASGPSATRNRAHAWRREQAVARSDRIGSRAKRLSGDASREDPPPGELGRGTLVAGWRGRGAIRASGPGAPADPGREGATRGAPDREDAPGAPRQRVRLSEVGGSRAVRRGRGW